MNQYFKIKEKHADYLLLFRMGDFYEMFFDDAVRASEVLHITVGWMQQVIYIDVSLQREENI